MSSDLADAAIFDDQLRLDLRIDDPCLDVLEPYIRHINFILCE